MIKPSRAGASVPFRCRSPGRLPGWASLPASGAASGVGVLASGPTSGPGALAAVRRPVRRGGRPDRCPVPAGRGPCGPGRV